MQTKTKISLTIDKNLLVLIERASNKYNMTRSQLAEKAFRLWIKTETEKLMARGYEEMAEEDRSSAAMMFHSQQELFND